jgi:hypothetical protein
MIPENPYEHSKGLTNKFGLIVKSDECISTCKACDWDAASKAWAKWILSDNTNARWIVFEKAAVCQFGIEKADFEALKKLAEGER